MAEPAHPAFKVYADTYFPTKEHVQKFYLSKKSFEANMEGLTDAVGELLGNRDKASRTRAEEQDRVIADLTARLEEAESAIALLRAIKPVRREDA